MTRYKRQIQLLLPIAAAALLIVAIFARGNEARPLPPGLEGVFPAETTKSLAQAVVGADLAAGYAGFLTINGTAIPESQLELDSGLDTVTFRPGADKVIERLLPNKNCATIELYEIAAGVDGPRSRRSWCFDVV